MGKGKKRALIMAVLGGMAALSYLPSAEAAGDTGTVGSKNSAMDEYSLDDTIVTAQRTEKSEMDTPATTTVITAEQIKKAGYRNVYEAIDQQIGVTSTSYGEAGQDFGFACGRITLRGYDRGTLVLVNGVPMNLKNYPSTENIPANMVERIEIVKGAASTLYGGNAMGGVINIILKKPSGITAGNVSTTLGNYFKKTEAFYQDGRVMVDVSREWSAAVPHENAFGIDKPSYTDWWNGSGTKNRVGVAFNLTDELSFNYDYTEGTITRGGTAYKKSGNKLLPTGKYYDYIYNDMRQTGNLVYQGKSNGLRAVLGYNYRRVDGYGYGNTTTTGPLTSNRTLDQEVFDLQKTWKLKADTLIAGYSYEREASENTYRHVSMMRSSNSLFASYSKQFSNRFNMTFGLRGEFINDPKASQHIFLPQLQTDYKIDKDTAWYINIGRAFQMPTIDDVLTYRNYNMSGLNPEKGWTYETGIKMRRGDETWKFALYHMAMENKFGWSEKDENGEQHPINKGDFRNTGFEAEYDKKINDVWGIKLGGSISNPEIKDPSVKGAGWTQDAGRLEFMAEINYKKAKWQGNLNYKYLGDREYYTPSNGHAGDTPSKLQLNLNLAYQCGKNDAISFAVYNLLDRKNYSDRWGDLDIGRNFRMTYTHSF